MTQEQPPEGDNQSQFSATEHRIAIAFSSAVLVTLIVLTLYPRAIGRETLAIVRLLAASFAGISGYLFAGHLGLEAKTPFNKTQIRATGAFTAFIIVFLFFLYGLPASQRLDQSSSHRAVISELQIEAEALKNSSSNELVSVLNLRAEHTLEMMENEKQKALASIRSGNGHALEAEYVREHEAMRELFIELHNKNIEAIESGQMSASYEITLEIHHLLWLRTRNTFWSAFAERDLLYGLTFDGVETYAELYPGERPKNLATEYSNQLEEIW